MNILVEKRRKGGRGGIDEKKEKEKECGQAC